MVVSRAVTRPSSIVDRNTHIVPDVIMNADMRMLTMSALVRMGSLIFRGGFLRTVWSTGSSPSDCAGGPSMITLIQRICMGLRGLGTSSSVDKEMSIRAEIEVDSWNVTKLRML